MIPQCSQTTLEALSVKELKTIASQIGAIPDGDKRIKQTWIDAIIDHQTKFSPIKVAAIEAHLQMVMNQSDSADVEIEVATSTSELPSDVPSELPKKPFRTTPRKPTPVIDLDDAPFPVKVDESTDAPTPIDPATDPIKPTQRASTVALVVVLALATAFGIVKTGLKSISWVVAALSPIALGLWRYLLPDPMRQDSIDYFPLPVG